MPPEIEWCANLSNGGTRRIYQNAVKDFMRFASIGRREEFRVVTRAHVIAWRDELVRAGLGGSAIRNRLASGWSVWAGATFSRSRGQRGRIPNRSAAGAAATTDATVHMICKTNGIIIST